MGQRRLTREERALWYLADYVLYRAAVHATRRICRREVKRCYGVSLETLRREQPGVYRAQLLEMESALDRSLHGRLKWLYRFGLKKLVAGILFAPPSEVALVMLALKHKRATRTAWNYLCAARRTRRLSSHSPPPPPLPI
jgi:hypothetical protein